VPEWEKSNTTAVDEYGFWTLLFRDGLMHLRLTESYTCGGSTAECTDGNRMAAVAITEERLGRAATPSVVLPPAATRSAAVLTDGGHTCLLPALRLHLLR